MMEDYIQTGETERVQFLILPKTTVTMEINIYSTIVSKVLIQNVLYVML
jgi:hypothetical protein